MEGAGPRAAPHRALAAPAPTLSWELVLQRGSPYYVLMAIWDVVTRILLAAVLAGVIGLEREIREHTAGFRTHILVAVGAAAFTLASSYDSAGIGFDPNRISAQVVTGIGFLGAGAIIRYGVTVRGLTTAASLWAVAAVGLLRPRASTPPLSSPPAW